MATCDRRNNRPITEPYADAETVADEAAMAGVGPLAFAEEAAGVAAAFVNLRFLSIAAEEEPVSKKLAESASIAAYRLLRRS